MNYLAGLLILYIKDDIDAFFAFCTILDKFNWRLLYIKGMPGLIRLLEILLENIRKKLPEIHNHFISQEINSTGLFSHVFLTCLNYRAPINFATQVFDLFLLHGETILIDSVINMLRLCKTKILGFKQEEVHEYIKGKMIEECYEKYGITGIFTN